MQAASGAQWEAVGHDAGVAWAGRLGLIGASVLALLLGALVVRAWLARRAYRAVDALDAAATQRVREQILDAERRTTGEIAVVVLERSDRHPAALWLSALVTALIGTVLLAPWLPWDLPAGLLAAQIALGAVGYGLARLLPGYQRLFVSEGRATEMAEEQALQEFHRYGLHGTGARSGVLLFVSLLERRIVVLGDHAIASCVAPDTWAGARDAVLQGIRAGSLRDGLVTGLRLVGDVLAEHCPWQEGDRNELPDILVVRRE